MGANPSAANLSVGLATGPKNACVKGESHDGGDVGDMECALGGVPDVVTPNVSLMEGVAGGLDVYGDCGCGLVLLPMLNEAVNSLKESVLGNGVEETH